ncbi:MAG: hypothetical protein QOI95_75 [Acidimicrobiaceae bacterium]|jgi:hypothetical protein
MSPPSTIGVRQASDRGLLLQRAADASHRTAQTIEAARLSISIAFGLLAIVATSLPGTAPTIAVSGGTWAFVSLSLGLIARRATKTASLVQEEFDTWLFGLEWSDACPDHQIEESELRRLARRSVLDESRLASWYPDVTGLHPVYAALVCQGENLSWDWRLRRRWSMLLSVGAVAWSIAGILLAILLDLSVRQIAIRWFAPSAAVLAMVLQQARAHRDVADTREQLATTVRSELRSARSGTPSTSTELRLWEVSRSVQDGLLASRKRAERVPRWLYERFRDVDESDMQETVEDLRSRLMDGQP